jgi:hypothetical protein
MYLRVQFEFLSPTVRRTEETDFCTEMLGIARDFQKGFRTGAKQEIVEHLLVLQDQWSQPVSQLPQVVVSKAREHTVLVHAPCPFALPIQH